MSKALKPAFQNGTRFADSIRASSPLSGCTNRPKTRLLPTLAELSNRDLQRGSHPDRTLASCPLSGEINQSASSSGDRVGDLVLAGARLARRLASSLSG